MERHLGEFFHRLGDRLALADRFGDLANRCSKTALPDVSRVMLSASRIGTPLETSVPRVRVVRARMFFSTSGSEDRHLQDEHVPAHAAGLELAQ